MSKTKKPFISVCLCVPVSDGRSAPSSFNILQASLACFCLNIHIYIKYISDSLATSPGSPRGSTWLEIKNVQASFLWGSFVSTLVRRLKPIRDSCRHLVTTRCQILAIGSRLNRLIDDVYYFLSRRNLLRSETEAINLVCPWNIINFIINFKLNNRLWTFL